MNRFGKHSLHEIDHKITKNVPANTTKTKNTMWRQFASFCQERDYKIEATTTEEVLADILKDWAYNMKKLDGSDYKETTVKAMWNGIAKQLQDKYVDEFKRDVDPFKNSKFKPARDARDAKRHTLQEDPEKRKKVPLP